MSDIDIPIVIGPAGMQPQSPQTINAALIAAVNAINPGYTILPAGLIEDISSTDTYAILQCNSALVELINSLTPFAANDFLLYQLGQIYGVTYGQPTNTSVYLVFSSSTAPGYVIPAGFVVSDGTYQYVVQDGGIISGGGSTVPLFAIATQGGSWAVPSGTVQQLVTSVPNNNAICLTVNNPLSGTPGLTQESQTSFRTRVLEAGLAVSQGMTTYLKTLLNNVPGVQPRLVSPLQVEGGGWEIVVGGGDPYQVAYAIFQALFDVSSLVGSTLAITSITKTNPGAVTTDLNHGYSTGQVVQINNVVGMTQVNGTSFTITVTGPTEFTLGVDTSGYTTYISGGVVTPNFRNVVVNVNDYPDTYSIPIVIPPEQTVTMDITWNTTSPNLISDVSISQAAGPAIVNYVNSITVGQPMNVFVLQTTFQEAVAAIVPPAQLSRLLFTVFVDGVEINPEVGTGLIVGDPESYFFTDTASLNIAQG